MAEVRSLLYNASVTGIAQIAGKILRFGVASLALKQFGAASWGEIAYALTVCTYVNFILDFGVSTLALVERPDDESMDRSLFVSLFYGRGIVAAPLVLLAIVAILQLDVAGGGVLAVYLFVALIRPLNLEWWLQRKGFAGTIPVVQVFRQMALLLVLWLAKPESLLLFVSIDVLSELAVAIVTWRVGPKRMFRLAMPNRGEWTNVLLCYKHSGVIFLSSSMILLLQSVDVFIVKHYCGLEMLGVYDFTLRFAQVAMMASGSLSVPLRRQIARFSDTGTRDCISLTMSAAFRLVALVGVLFAFYAVFGAPYVFSKLLSENQAQIADELSIIMAVWLVLLFATFHFAESIVVLARRSYLWMVAIGAGADIVANLILVPRFGVLGAAWAKVATEAVLLACAVFIARSLFKARYYSVIIGLSAGLFVPILYWIMGALSVVWGLPSCAFILLILWKSGFMKLENLKSLRIY